MPIYYVVAAWKRGVGNVESPAQSLDRLLMPLRGAAAPQREVLVLKRAATDEFAQNRGRWYPVWIQRYEAIGQAQ